MSIIALLTTKQSTDFVEFTIEELNNSFKYNSSQEPSPPSPLTDESGCISKTPILPPPHLINLKFQERHTLTSLRLQPKHERWPEQNGPALMKALEIVNNLNKYG